MRDRRSGEGMTLTVRTVTRLTVGLILLFGICIVVGDHDSPGGGFPGGVIIALAFIHLILGFGKRAFRRNLVRTVPSLAVRLDAPRLMSLGMAAFLCAFLVHSALAGRGHDMRPYGALLTSLCQVFVAVNVAAGLFAVFSSLAAIRIDRK
ncbi:MAG: MnhB domain-containing protein [Chlamydiota bacterium]